jgi:hypothetical protein
MPAISENIRFSYLLSKNTDIKIYRTVILPEVLYECDTLSCYGKYSNWICVGTLTVSEYVWGQRLTVSQNRVLRGQFGSEGPLHNWCTWQMCKWFFIAHRVKWMLFGSLFGSHLLLQLVVKSLSGRCYRIPTSCLLGCPSYWLSTLTTCFACQV